jgi:uncharacterized protein
MPINAPREYFLAEEKFHNAKTKDEKIIALEEMLRLMPRHHGSENMLATLKARLSKLKKETTAKKGGRVVTITKEGEAQVCLIGFTNSGKSYLLSRITDAKPLIAAHPYTTTKPELGMMDYRGVKVQIVEIPATFEGPHMSIARSADLIVLVARHEKEEEDLKKMLQNIFIRTKTIIANPFAEPPDHIKEKIWHALGLMVVYTKRKASTERDTPMALRTNATIKDFAMRIHKDFIRNFRFARITRKGRLMQAGIDYVLKDGDVVELYMS